MAGVIIVTMNDLPGYESEEVFGEVFGLTVRSRNIGSVIGATHLRARLDVDRDLRLRHGRERAAPLSAHAASR